MDKAVYSGMVLISLVLIAGSYWFPDSAAMWLASTSILMNIARGIIAALMLGLLFTNPPRRREFRIVLGIAAAGFLVAALERAYGGSVLVADALLFMGAGVSFGLAALEGKPLPERATAALSQPLSRYDNPFSMSKFGYALATKTSTVSRSAELLGKAMITASIVTGALQQNIRPYKTIWRGS